MFNGDEATSASPNPELDECKGRLHSCHRVLFTEINAAVAAAVYALLSLERIYTQLYFTKKKIGSTQQFKKKRKEKQQYKQDDNHLVTNVGSLQSRQFHACVIHVGLLYH